MESRMKRSVAFFFMSRSSVDNKTRSCAVTVLRRRHDDVLAARELADARGPHLHSDLSLIFPAHCQQAQGRTQMVHRALLVSSAHNKRSTGGRYNNGKHLDRVRE